MIEEEIDKLIKYSEFKQKVENFVNNDSIEEFQSFNDNLLLNLDKINSDLNNLSKDYLDIDFSKLYKIKSSLEQCNKYLNSCQEINIVDDSKVINITNRLKDKLLISEVLNNNINIDFSQNFLKLYKNNQLLNIAINSVKQTITYFPVINDDIECFDYMLDENGYLLYIVIQYKNDYLIVNNDDHLHVVTSKYIFQSEACWYVFTKYKDINLILKKLKNI